MTTSEPTPTPLSQRSLSASAHDSFRLVNSLAHYADDSQLILRSFDDFIYSSRLPFTSWQQAWNEFAKSGTITLHPSRCSECHGKHFSVKSYARSGSMVCASCSGTGKGRPVTVHALQVPLP